MVRQPLRERLAVTVTAAAAAVAASFAVAGPTPAFVGAPVAQFVTTVTPGAVVTFGIEQFGSLAQPMVLAGAIAVTVLAFVLAVEVGRDVAARVDAPAVSVFLPLVAVTALAYAIVQALAPAVAAGLAAGVVLALATVDARSLDPAREPDRAGPADGDQSADRRQLLRSVAGGAVLSLVGTALGSRGGLGRSSGNTADSAGGDLDGTGGGASDDPAVAAMLSAARDRSLSVPGLEPLVSRDHYTVDIATVDPDLSADDWSLTVTGVDGDEHTYTFEDLQSFPTEHRFVTLRCVGEELNGRKMDTALWTGVPVSALLEDAGVSQQCCVRVRADDDYFQGFPYAALGDALLALGMNGGPLPRAHGHPARLLVPGHWGEINVKWITALEARDEEVIGYWEQRGWHGTGPVNTVAKLHSVDVRPPVDGAEATVVVGGHAYAGTRGIERVEVSTDGGETWAEAELSDRLPGRVSPGATTVPSEPADDAWRMWRHEYTAAEPHDVVVRAVDGTGTLQPEEVARAFPSGATGWVSRRVRP
jgi:hypothetical protein